MIRDARDFRCHTRLKDDLELQGLLDALAFLAVKEIIIVDGEVQAAAGTY